MEHIVQTSAYSKFHKEDRNQSHYFYSLLKLGVKTGAFTQEELFSIQRQLLQLLRDVTLKYTSGDSSSVTVERGNQLLANISYKISLCLKGQRGAKEALSLMKNYSVLALYEKGEEIAGRKTAFAKILLDKTRENQMAAGNIAYRDTLGKGLQEFFYYYDYRFEANQNPGMIDYPLTMKHTGLSGIELIHEYLQGLYMENQFCMNFDSNRQESIYRGYDKGYEDLLINLFEHTLINALGCMLCRKPPEVLSIWGEDYECIANRLIELNTDQITLLLKEQTDLLFEVLRIKNMKMKEHAYRYLEEISSRVELCFRLDKLSLVFIEGIS